MNHLHIIGHGRRIGITGNRILISSNEGDKEYPLKKIKTITIEKEGLGISSDLLLACSNRGIKFFVSDFKGTVIACLSGSFDHSISKSKMLQYDVCRNDISFDFSKKIILGKVINQRSVLLYFSKNKPSLRSLFQDHIFRIETIITEIQNLEVSENWRAILMGLEGAAASIYFGCIQQAELFSPSFLYREGQGSTEVSNSALNYGYSILQTTIWSAVVTAGLDPWVGFLHVPRPGKPSLVLDLMEEYRAWVVDRNIIKLRANFKDKTGLTVENKKMIISSIRETLSNSYPYYGKRVKLEHIIQRQIYKLVGCMAKNTKWSSYRFKW